MSKKKYNDIIIPLAWPDMLVRTAGGMYDRFLEPLKLQRNGFYKVGHAALLLIDVENKVLKYCDFGRYITPPGYGRIRTEESDPEIKFDITPEIINGQLTNLEEILLYTNNHPYTHGEGRLYAAVHQNIDFSKALNYIRNKQAKGHVKYGPYTIGGSNCSRFVAQSIFRASQFAPLHFLFPWYGTPSPLGNIFFCKDDKFFCVDNNQVFQFEENRNIVTRVKHLSDSLRFKPNEQPPHAPKAPQGTIAPPDEKPTNHAQWLGGTGAGAWHQIEAQNGSDILFKRIQKDGNIDIEAWYSCKTQGFDFQQEYTFVHGTTGRIVIIRQKEVEFIFVPKFD